MSEDNKKKPAFNIVFKSGKGQPDAGDKVYLFSGWEKEDQNFPGFDLGVGSDKVHGKPVVTILLEYPDGTEKTIRLDSAGKSSTHFAALYDNRGL